MFICQNLNLLNLLSLKKLIWDTLITKMDILGMIEINGVDMDAICLAVDMVTLMVVMEMVLVLMDFGWDKDIITKELKLYIRKTMKLKVVVILHSDTDKLIFFKK